MRMGTMPNDMCRFICHLNTNSSRNGTENDKKKCVGNFHFISSSFFIEKIWILCAFSVRDKVVCIVFWDGQKCAMRAPEKNSWKSELEFLESSHWRDWALESDWHNSDDMLRFAQNVLKWCVAGALLLLLLLLTKSTVYSRKIYIPTRPMDDGHDERAWASKAFTAWRCVRIHSGV